MYDFITIIYEYVMTINITHIKNYISENFEKYFQSRNDDK